jgi:hypothetical protein
MMQLAAPAGRIPTSVTKLETTANTTTANVQRRRPVGLMIIVSRWIYARTVRPRSPSRIEAKVPGFMAHS